MHYLLYIANVSHISIFYRCISNVSNRAQKSSKVKQVIWDHDVIGQPCGKPRTESKSTICTTVWSTNSPCLTSSPEGFSISLGGYKATDQSPFSLYVPCAASGVPLQESVLNKARPHGKPTQISIELKYLMRKIIQAGPGLNGTLENPVSDVRWGVDPLPFPFYNPTFWSILCVVACGTKNTFLARCCGKVGGMTTHQAFPYSPGQGVLNTSQQYPRTRFHSNCIVLQRPFSLDMKYRNFFWTLERMLFFCDFKTKMVPQVWLGW